MSVRPPPLCWTLLPVFGRRTIFRRRWKRKDAETIHPPTPQRPHKGPQTQVGKNLRVMAASNFLNEFQCSGSDAALEYRALVPAFIIDRWQ
jgi:hypothetical protein